MATSFGAEAVHLTEEDPRAAAKTATGGRGVDVAIDCVGDPRALELAIRLARMCGTVQCVGVYAERVYLNEALTFSFSEVLDRASVTADSVRIVDEQGGEARGRLEVHGSSLRFVPVLPMASDLSDAGLRPGRRYSLELAGFPRPDGLNSIHGHPLATTLQAAFTTVPVSGPNGEPKSWLLFDDEFPATRAVLKLFPAARGPSGGAYVKVSGPYCAKTRATHRRISSSGKRSADGCMRARLMTWGPEARRA